MTHVTVSAAVGTCRGHRARHPGCAGEFGWIEATTGLPISTEIAHLLTPEDLLGDIATARHRVPLARARPWPAPELEALIENATTLTTSRRSTHLPTR